MAVQDRQMALGDDDLPRTLRREREAQERAKMGSTNVVPPPIAPVPHAVDWSAGGQQVVVTDLKVPFFRLMMFMIKAVVAGIPALILLLAILWGLGQALTTFFPWLVKLKILISIPN